MRKVMRAVLVGGALVMALGGQAHGATTVGETFTPTQVCGKGTTWLQSAAPAGGYGMPTAGVVTAWSHHAADSPPPLIFKVFRPAGANSFTFVGQSPATPMNANVLNTNPVRIPVAAGDRIGFFISGSGSTYGCASPTSNPEHFIHVEGGDIGAGTTTFNNTNSSFKLDVSAVLEADADGDGFGDDTQDGCPSQAATQGACVPPETTIKSGPVKIDKAKARFTFESSAAASTFQCRLKGKGVTKALKQYAPCASPQKYKKLDPGNYKFLVFATDAGGTADPSPAKQRFKIVEEL